MSALTRPATTLLTAAALGLGLVACGQSEAQDLSKAPAAPMAAADISRVDVVAHDFPAGFTVNAGLSKTLSRSDVDRSGMDILTRATLNPAHCLSMIVPQYAHPAVGAEVAGVTASGDLGGAQITALRMPEAFSSGAAPAGCDRVVISGSGTASGIAERVAAPTIAGVATTGVKLVEDGARDAAHYIYTAAVDDRTVVVVRSSLDEQLHPQQFLSNLLVEAVAAVRGR